MSDGRGKPRERQGDSGEGRDNLVGRALGSGQALQGPRAGAGRALSAEEGALVFRGQASNRQGNTGSPCAEAAGGGEQRGTHGQVGRAGRMAGRGGFWGGKEASGEGADPGTGLGQVPKELERGRKGQEEEDHTRIT